MARWRLINAHYLNVPGTEWEYKETDRNTGRQVRRVFPVPLFLDPKDPADHNYKEDGEIIVSNGEGSHPRDIIFLGQPTPDMEPLDDEAKAISEAESPKWVHPIESLSGQSYSQSLLSDLEKQLSALVAGQQAKPAAPVSASGIDPDAFAKLQEQVAALMARNAELEATQTIKRRA